MIKFIRKYEIFNRVYYDVIHEPSHRIYTYTETDLPKTAKAFINGKTPVKQYDKIYKRSEYIYG